MLTEEENNDSMGESNAKEKNQKQNMTLSKLGSFVSVKSGKSNYGYPTIPNSILEKNLNVILRWINENLAISKMDSFPSDMIVNFGSQLYDLVLYKQIYSNIIYYLLINI